MAQTKAPRRTPLSPERRSAPAPAAKPQRGRRIRLLLTLAAVVAGARRCSISSTGCWSRSKHVDDRQRLCAGQHRPGRPPWSAARWSHVPIHETQAVKQGQVLAVIDPTDYRLAVDRARADLDQAERPRAPVLRQRPGAGRPDRRRAAPTSPAPRPYTAPRAGASTIAARPRRRPARSRATSSPRPSDASSTGRAAAARRPGPRQRRRRPASSRRPPTSWSPGSAVAANPEVAAARTELDQAQLDLARTVIRAPVDGVVARPARCRSASGCSPARR